MRARAQNQQPVPRELPCNIEAEQALLGACFVNNAAFASVSSFLAPEDFFEPLHGRIYKAIGDLILMDRAANPVTVKAALTAEGNVGDMTIAQYVARLATEAVSVINAEDYGRAILDLSLRRSLISLGEEMVNRAYDSPLDAPTVDQIEFAEQAVSELSSIHRDQNGGGRFTGSAIVAKYLDMVSGDPKKRAQNGVPTSLKEISTVLSEEKFEPGNLYGMLSSSGEGKTSLVLGIVRAALRNGNPVLFLSYDQSGLQIVAQMAAQELGIETRLQRGAQMTEPQVDRALGYVSSIASSPFEVKDCSSSKDTASRLVGYARQFLKKHKSAKTPLIIVDHAGTIKSERDDRSADEGTRARNNAQELKDLAKLSNCSVLLLMQRPSSGLKRFNPRPTRQDVYGGQAAMQPFDAIFYLYRAEYHLEEQLKMAADDREADKIRARFAQQYGPDIEGTAEIGAVKVRFGSSAIRRKVKFIAEFTRYETMHTYDYDQGCLL